MKSIKPAFIWIFFLFYNITILSTETSNSSLTSDIISVKVDSLAKTGKHDDAMNLLNNFIDNELTKTPLDNKTVSWAYLKKGQLYQSSGQNHQSVKPLERAVKHAFQSRDSIELSNAYHELGNSYTIMGRYEDALEVYTKALEIDRELESWIGVAIDLNSIGKIYELWKHYKQALDFLYQSLEISKKINNQNLVALRMASIGSVYKSIGELETAMEWLNNSLELEKKLNNTIRIGYRLDQIGEIYILMNNFNLAENYLKQALAIFEENNIDISKSIVMNHLGLNSFKKGNINNAIKYYNESYKIAQNIEFNNMLQKNQKELSTLYEETGNYYNALKHYKEYIALKDTAFSEKAQQELMYFQVKYETEQKEKELALLNQNKLEQDLELNKSNQQRLFMIGISIVLLIFSGALYNRYYIKKRTQVRLSAINKQLEETNKTKDKFFNILAHDLKNPIYSFRNISSAMHESFSDLSPKDINEFTYELKNSSTKLSNFIDELLKWAASQRGHLNPKKESFKIKPLIDELIGLMQSMLETKKLSVSIDIADSHIAYADKNMIHTVFRNILTNAIKFTPQNGWIKIQSIIDKKLITVKVTDSGIGISDDDINKLFNIGNDTSKIGESEEKGSGFGLILCNEFIEKNNGSIKVESSLGKGSSFIISLPINSDN